MSYINKENLLSSINEVWEHRYERSNDKVLYDLYRMVIRRINRAQASDVAEVVRCKDCKHATFYSCKNDACYQSIICEYRIGIGDENFFCACGERR